VSYLLVLKNNKKIILELTDRYSYWVFQNPVSTAGQVLAIFYKPVILSSTNVSTTIKRLYQMTIGDSQSLF